MYIAFDKKNLIVSLQLFYNSEVHYFKLTLLYDWDLENSF